MLVNQQPIYKRLEQFFTSNSMLAIERADFDGGERLALVTGGDIASTFDELCSFLPGDAAVVEEAMIGEDTAIRFGGCSAGEACTIVLRGMNMNLLNEAEGSLRDALCVLSQTVVEPRTVLGGVYAETLIACE